jgi:cytochrome c oxidase cbb3-type subunit III
VRLRLLSIAAAGLIPLAMSGCSASDPPPSDAAAPAASAQSTALPPATPAPGTPTQAVSGTVPPALAPVGPIPGPQLAGENPATAIQNPYSNDPSALEEGRQLFVAMNCAGCHGGHAGGGMGPTLRSPKDWLYGNTPANIFDSISMGRGKGMPAWGTKLPPEVIWKITLYVQSLGSPQEPDKAAPAPAHAPESVAAQVF